jgi:hypothetical protein
MFLELSIKLLETFIVQASLMTIVIYNRHIFIGLFLHSKRVTPYPDICECRSTMTGSIPHSPENKRQLHQCWTTTNTLAYHKKTFFNNKDFVVVSHYLLSLIF